MLTEAGAAEVVSANTTPVNNSQYLFLGGILVMLLFVLLFMYSIFQRMQKDFFGQKETELPKVQLSGIKFFQTKAIEEEEELMTDHVYDDIRELDNNLPLWWRYLLYGTIVFAVVYMVRYHVMSGPLQLDEYEAELAEAAIMQEEYRKNNAAKVDETTATYLADAEALSIGKKLYTDNCFACHGGGGEGGVGPNLTDDYWIHGGGIGNIFKTIKYGVPEKGMKSWQAELKPVEIQQVSSFIMSLRGTNPPNQKEAQGELYEEEAPSDSTVTMMTDL